MDNDNIKYEPLDSAEDSFTVIWQGQVVASLDKLYIHPASWVVGWWHHPFDEEDPKEFEREFNTKAEAQTFIAAHILDIANGKETN